MSCKRCLSRIEVLYKLLVYFGVTVGFGLQFYLVSYEYFKYPTTTHVSIVDALNETVLPQTAICSPLKRPPWFRQLRDLFNINDGDNVTLADMTRNIFSGIKMSNNKDVSGTKYISIRRF